MSLILIIPAPPLSRGLRPEARRALGDPADELCQAGMLAEGGEHSLVCSKRSERTDWVESLSVRLCRVVRGQHRHDGPQYLYQYANHAAWFEDDRRTDKGTLANVLVGSAMGLPGWSQLDGVLAAGGVDHNHLWRTRHEHLDAVSGHMVKENTHAWKAWVLTEVRRGAWAVILRVRHNRFCARSASVLGSKLKGAMMATMTAALVREQGVTFAVAVVRNHVLNSPQSADQTIRAVSQALDCPLVVLMGESNRKLRGNRQDIVSFVSRLDPARLPWRKWNV